MTLQYPIDNVPTTGNAVTIHPDIKWLRSPLPLSLNHINCYLLRDGDGWAIVDTGMNSDAARAQWLAVLDAELQGAPITRIFATHHHPDHVGLAGWLCERFRVPLWMSESEYFHARTFNAPLHHRNYWEIDQYFRHAGMSLENQQSLYANDDFNHMVSEVPAAYHRLTDQQRIRIGEHEWLAITSRGHAPEHLSLYCAELNIYLSGDQLLPKITSNVMVDPTAPEANPLADWLDSHVRLPALIAADALVLPAHQKPFMGAHERLQQVVEHHQQRLDKLLTLCQTAQTAQQLTAQLFDRKLDAFQNFLAVGECLAHLHYLLAQGNIQRTLKDQVHYFSA